MLYWMQKIMEILLNFDEILTNEMVPEVRAGAALIAAPMLRGAGGPSAEIIGPLAADTYT